ncbi:glycoside hydrolase family 30 protein [Reichenbachiella agariperforans]|uniref:glycoside hydrolase family 30 protein n=1 Tax=Reichenbachiella agariperforans TaxID=156994 RepID=UPI001C0952E3|nr:glycoside hydrolase family 30 beta sandwich domain-containing protein [Reichenbachiella agariperforans]MBU2915514.1 glucosylceramidase [Reichenbachiella agariperforans]
MNRVLTYCCGLMLAACGAKDSQEISDNQTQSLHVEPVVQVYVTDASRERQLEESSDLLGEPRLDADVHVFVEPTQMYQQMEGFGFALTGGSVYHLSQMNEQAQSDLLQELFGVGTNDIGVSYLRISIAASDLDAEVYSYNDLPAGETDLMQENFSIERERELLIPMLKKIQAINPNIKIMASPWSPPVWMKTNGSSIGGHLKEEYYDSYALYLTKYFQAMEAEGITIETMTIQNEPLHPGNNPSMSMEPEEQANFIERRLGPAFAEKGIKTKIVLYDHNADRPDYPISILDRPEVRKYVAGSAFHMYGGSIAALSDVHSAHPDKGLYFTEQWFGAPGNFPEDLKWHVRELMIGAPRNWSRSVIEWNLSSAPDLQPHTDGGCSQCLGGITIDGDEVTRNAGYYSIGHASKFVRPGAKRIASNAPEELPNVAFLTPENQIVLLAINNTDTKQICNITQGEQSFSAVLEAGSTATFIWDN